MSVAEKLQSLRLILGEQKNLFKKDYFTAPQLDENTIPRGAIVELIGSYKTEWAAQMIALHPDLKVFWAENHLSILPTALHQRGALLSQITFAVVPKDLVAALRRAIQSQVYGLVFAPNAFDEIKIFQAFQLFTEKANATLFLFGKEKPCTAWPISLQLEIHKSGEGQFEIEILKQKHGKHAR